MSFQGIKIAEPWFVCAAHTDEDVATSLQVFEESLTEALAAR
jgi:glutamate-1-semialdehyde aminotransferase